MSAVLSLLQSRLLRPVFVTLGIALLVQVLVAVALTRSTVTALEAELEARLGVTVRNCLMNWSKLGVRSPLVWTVCLPALVSASPPVYRRA